MGNYQYKIRESYRSDVKANFNKLYNNYKYNTTEKKDTQSHSFLPSIDNNNSDNFNEECGDNSNHGDTIKNNPVNNNIRSFIPQYITKTKLRNKFCIKIYCNQLTNKSNSNDFNIGKELVGEIVETAIIADGIIFFIIEDMLKFTSIVGISNTFIKSAKEAREMFKKGSILTIKDPELVEGPYTEGLWFISVEEPSNQLLFHTVDNTKTENGTSTVSLAPSDSHGWYQAGNDLFHNASTTASGLANGFECLNQAIALSGSDISILLSNRAAAFLNAGIPAYAARDSAAALWIDSNNRRAGRHLLISLKALNNINLVEYLTPFIELDTGSMAIHEKSVAHGYQIENKLHLFSSILESAWWEEEKEITTALHDLDNSEVIAAQNNSNADNNYNNDNFLQSGKRVQENRSYRPKSHLQQNHISAIDFYRNHHKSYSRSYTDDKYEANEFSRDAIERGHHHVVRNLAHHSYAFQSLDQLPFECKQGSSSGSNNNQRGRSLNSVNMRRSRSHSPKRSHSDRSHVRHSRTESRATAAIADPRDKGMIKRLQPMSTRDQKSVDKTFESFRRVTSRSLSPPRQLPSLRSDQKETVQINESAAAIMGLFAAINTDNKQNRTKAVLATIGEAQSQPQQTLTNEDDEGPKQPRWMTTYLEAESAFHKEWYLEACVGISKSIAQLIEMDASNTLSGLLCHRSIKTLHAGKAELSLLDATVACVISPTSSVAWFRRAVALERLTKYEVAVKAVSTGKTTLHSRDYELKAEYDNLDKRIERSWAQQIEREKKAAAAAAGKTKFKRSAAIVKACVKIDTKS